MKNRLEGRKMKLRAAVVFQVGDPGEWKILATANWHTDCGGLNAGQGGGKVAPQWSICEPTGWRVARRHLQQQSP